MSPWLMLTLSEIGLFYGATKAPWAWMRIGFAFIAGGYFTLALLNFLGAIQ